MVLYLDKHHIIQFTKKNGSAWGLLEHLTEFLA